MLIVLFIIFLLMIIIGWILEYNDNFAVSFVGTGGIIIGCVIEFFIVGFIINFCYDISKSTVIDSKISMYQQENKKIEKEITEVVNSYKDYEKEVITNTGEMATVLIRFPELKSNELVSKQIQVYVDNNNKIKKLKEEKINYSISKWWLYFGK